MKLLSFRSHVVEHISDDVLLGFLNNKAPNTKKSYISVYHAWISFLDKKRVGLLEAKPIHAVSFLAEQAEHRGQECREDPGDNSISKSTMRYKAIILSNLYKFIQEYQENDERRIVNPFTHALLEIKKAQTGDKRPTELIPFSKLKELINRPRNWTPDGRRDRALLHTLAGTGMRISEVQGLKIRDIKQADDGTLFAQLHKTKSGHPQKRAFAPFASEVLMQYIKERLEEGADVDDYIFTSYRGPARLATHKALSVSTCQRLIASYAKDLGLKNISPHSFRVTVATKLLSENCNYREVQEVLGHASIRMTEKYDKRRIEITQSAAKKLAF